VTDDPNAALTVPGNRGNEGMAYLTYIIDHYDELPSVMIFQHASRYQWHNDDPLYDGQRMLEQLSIPFVKQEGYVNLRCVWKIGCPVEIHPFTEEYRHALEYLFPPKAGSYYRQAFEYLFPDLPVPSEVGVSCCAQFAVTAAKVQERPKRDYERYRRWIVETPLDDNVSGRIMEYSWHIMFGKDSVHCPDASTCYCNLYGLCDLVCEEQGLCKSQYTFVGGKSMPQGWPEYGWKGEWRNVTQMRTAQALDYAPSPAPG